MTQDRWIEPDDMTLLEVSLERDPHHVGTSPEFFLQPGTVCKVYSDEIGPVLYARASKTLRLDLQYVDNNDRKRNMRVMIDGLSKLEETARANGFTEVIFQTNHDLLMKFCTRHLGFFASEGELRKPL